LTIKSGIGAVGVEFAAEIKSSSLDTEVFLIHSRTQLLSAEPLPEKLKQRSADLLTNLDITVLLSCRVVASEDSTDTGFKTTLQLSNGTQIGADKVIYTNSPHAACTSFLPEQALNAHGYINVRPT